MRTPKLASPWRLVIAFVVFALVAAACGDDDATSTSAPTTTATTLATTTTAGEVTTTTEAPPALVYVNKCEADVPYSTEPYVAPTYVAPTGGATYSTGIFQDMTTSNYWSYLDPQSTVWNQYVLGATKPTLFINNAPGWELTYDVAAPLNEGDALVDEAALQGMLVEDGDGWSVTVALRDDVYWSDGVPITANDVEFTADTVCQLGLGGNWLGAYQWAQVEETTGEPLMNDATGEPVLGLTAVTAIDDLHIKFTWNGRPGLPIWPYAPGVGPIMPKHVWQAVVEGFKTAEDPATSLYDYDPGAMDASAGAMVYESREPGAFARTVASPDFYDEGRVITSLGTTYPLGPFFGDQVYSLYGDQSAAVLALKAGDVDYIYNPLGLQRGLLSQLTDDPNLTVVTNATNGFRYLAFNLREEPMSNQGFRDALAFMINKEYVATSVLQNVAFPLYATLPEGNAAWYNEEVADAFGATYTDLSLDTRYDGTPFATPGADETLGTADDEPYTATGTEARLHAAVAALLANGFSYPEGQGPDFQNRAIVPACGGTPGCIMLNGETIEQLEILAPGPGYDPLRATYSILIAQSLTDLGFNARALPTDFGVIVNRVFTPTDEGTLDWQMYILGYSLGSPAMPTYHESFWAGKNDTLVNGGNNATGFNDPDFNALVEEFNQAESKGEAYDILWQMEEIFFAKKPFILLFDTGIVEAYRSAAVTFPFTGTLSGLQLIGGGSGIARPAAS